MGIFLILLLHIMGSMSYIFLMITMVIAEPSYKYSSEYIDSLNITAMKQLCEENGIEWRDFRNTGRRLEYIARLEEVRAEPENDIAPGANAQSPPNAIDVPAAEHPITRWFTETVGLAQYARVLIEAGYIDLFDIARITERHLRAVGIDVEGHIVRILRFIESLNASQNNDDHGNSNNNDQPSDAPRNRQVAPVVAAPSRGLLIEFRGTVIRAVLFRGGRTSADIRKNVVWSIQRSRFSVINKKRDRNGRLSNSGRHVTKRAIISLSNVALVAMSNVFDPELRRRGDRRGGHRYWYCDVARSTISAAFNALDDDGKERLKQFMVTFKEWVNWINYAIMCGDAGQCRALHLFDDL